MKYMGSKRKMLQNGLGALLRQEMRTARRFVDLFSGSGVVSRFVAERFRKPVVAVDLQAFATTLAASWLCRTSKIKSTACADRWVEVGLFCIIGHGRRNEKRRTSQLSAA